ncbi:phospholipase effector Tle1 domain-containing protein [Candidatus Berkiella aquae]|uniref:DUF2235 domain-containing protein n=1 Tax=Candidatus Berkiella aquae TaxID=295108 RepID=A0A0Q9YVW1_9GAMM|nr:DUF2235 domain-containing protein [Candidatus Berkiella aquae]MCS5710008.1 DUF2235 domain-containing protein [Candidatus Berkiella aquae]
MADIHFVILFNGTSNDDKDVSVTNIVKMRDGLKQNDKQFIIYRDGIGNDKQWRWFLPRLFAEITGYGSGWIMHQAYRELQQTLTQAINNGKIKSGDTLHFSVGGFSRGAAIARDFANHLTQRVTRVIRSKFQLAINIKLDCEYLFDTVPSFGIPINLWLLEKFFGIRNQLIDLGWNFSIPSGTKVYHAVAADERRNAFTPNLVNFKARETEEVWFDGDHSSIGGGYTPPTKETKMADENTLRYMVRRAINNGLQFETSFLQKFALSQPDHSLGMIKAPTYDVLPSTQRGPRTITVKENDSPSQRIPQISVSIIERMRIDPTYRPENIMQLQALDLVKESGEIESYSAERLKQLWKTLTSNKVLRFHPATTPKAKIAAPSLKSPSNPSKTKRRTATGV